MIPEGWALVPVVPSERMLTEFSGVWAQWLPKKRRELELQAYSAMLAVVPSSPIGGDTELEAVKNQLRTVEANLRAERAKSAKLQRDLNKAYSLLGQAQKRARG